MRTLLAIVIGLAISSGIFWYQNPDLELKVPDAVVEQFQEQRAALQQVPYSFAELEATSIPLPVVDTNVETGRKVARTAPIDERSVDKVSELEKKVHAGINAARATQGSSPQLRWEARLGAVARAHSEDMTGRNYFSHDTPEGLGPSDRIDKVGYSCWKGSHYGVAENLTIELADADLDHIARNAVQSWMNSPGHRTNLLGRQYDLTGVGASYGRWRGYSAVYLTQVFC